MGLSASHIGELVAELEPLVAGARVLDVQALPPRDLLVVLEPPAETGRVLRVRASCDAEAGRIHLQIAPVQRHEGPADPFFARTAEVLAGAELRSIEQLQGDRVVRLAFRSSGRPVAALLFELTGRHANAVLLDGSGRVLAVLVPPAAHSPAAARLGAGAAYALPPGRKAAGAPEPALRAAFPEPADAGRLAERAPLSARVEAALGGVSARRFEDGQRRELVRRLERRLASAAAELAGLAERERACAQAERVRQDGELLLAHMKAIPRGVKEVELADDFEPDGPPRRIALDPGLNPRRNAEKLFARYKKLVRTLERLPAERALAAAAHERVSALLARAAHDDPAGIEAEALAAGLLHAAQEAPRKAARPEPRLPYVRFAGLRGSEIRVGRSAADNDRLTFRAARGNDVWLHTADTPGSHVVLRLDPGREPDPEEVLDAAHLAVHFSPLRGTPRADVHVARQKEVHKPRKAPAGLVTLSGGKVLRVRMEAARLARLLAGRGRGPAGAEPA